MNQFPKPLREKWFLDRYNYLLVSMDGSPVRATTMLTGKGCPMKCKFCEDASTGSRRYSVENICSQLEDVKNLGYGGVYLFDDLFALSERVMRPYCEALTKYGLIYRCNGHANTLTGSMAKLLADTGCVELAFGAESGSQTILDKIAKGTKVEQNFKFVEIASQYGIRVKAFMMVGLPGESYETIQESIAFYKHLKKYDCPVQLAVFYPYEGTPFAVEYKKALALAKEKSIKPGSEEWYGLFDLYVETEGCGAYNTKGARSHSTVRTRTLSSDVIEQLRDKLFARYANPNFVSDPAFFDRHLKELQKQNLPLIYNQDFDVYLGGSH